ncbi:hypothetical protein [Eubacterium sp.]|uniref:hypothetical protein n=1 Tax=Eubacterium sp. TaxID=142586 RepID=UPI002A7F6DDD|nr:hypothetical protein [Eubacterium sp.]MDY3811315.1 hypothetical protein [Eubacterium sp.]
MTKENVKKLIPQVLKVLAFVLTFAVLLQTLSVFVFSGEKVSQISKRMADSYSFLSESENSVDVVCVGNSDIRSGFVPTELWEKYGYTSVVSSFTRQSISDSQRELKEICKSQKPKLVILEIDSLYDGRGPKDIINSHDTTLENFFDSLKPDAFENKISRDYSIFTFHNIWKDYNKKSRRSKYAHGYLYSDVIKKMEYQDYMAKTNELDVPNYTNTQQLRAFVKFCKEKNLPLLFLELPSISSWTYARHNAVQNLSDELGVELLDLNLLYDEVGIDMRNCFRDGGNHLNYFGAVAVTDYIGKYIGENYGIESRRDDAELAEYWDNEVVQFKKSNKIKQSNAK